MPEQVAAPAPSSGRKKTPSAHGMGGGAQGMHMGGGGVSLSGRISPLGALGSTPSNYRWGCDRRCLRLVKHKGDILLCWQAVSSCQPVILPAAPPGGDQCSKVSTPL